MPNKDRGASSTYSVLSAGTEIKAVAGGISKGLPDR